MSDPKPVRLQLSRWKGFDLQAISRATNGLPARRVDRSTVFGNISTCTRPHHCALRPCKCCPGDNDGWCCVLAFREYIESGIEGRPSRTGLFRYALDASFGYPMRQTLIIRLPELRGCNLACWCKPSDPCHADVLLELANKETADA
jgi:hypothetical protein